MSSSVKSIVIKSAKLIALFFISLFLLIWLLSPYVIQHYAAKYLSEQQLILADQTTIRYNPFDSSLVINDLEITTPLSTDKTVIAISSLAVKVSLYKLLDNTLHFSKFTIDGLYLDVNLNNKEPIIGGFVIASNSNEAETVEALEESGKEIEKSNSNDEANNYQVSLPKFILTNATFNIAVEQSQQEFMINSLEINNVLASTKAQQAEVELNALINKAPLSLLFNVKLANNQGEISSELVLSELDLTPFQPFLSGISAEQAPLTMQGLVSIKSKQLISLTHNSNNISLEAFELITKDLKAVHKNKAVALNITPLSMNNLSVELIHGQAPIITGTAKLNVSDIIAYDEKESLLLAKIAGINLDEIAIKTSNSLITANIHDLLIEQSIFADNTADDFLPLAKFQALSINGIALSEQGVSINTIELLGLAIDTNLDKDKTLVGLPTPKRNELPVEVPTKETVEQSSEVGVKAQSPKSAFLLSLNSFSFSDTGHIKFTDHSTSPIYQRDFKITKFDAGPFDNQQPEQESLLKLTGSSNQYASFDLSAIAKPFSEKDFYQLKGFFKEVSLPSLSTYISEALKYELKSGQLDVELDVTIDNTEIDGNAILLLRGIELGAANDHEDGTIKSQTSMPFNIALGMLKDSDGNVELDIPLDGNTNAPSFGIRGFISLMIKQATMSAAKEYLMVTFVPYANVVSVAMSAGDYLLKVRFNDLLFPIKETQLSPQHHDFLTQFSVLMKNKPDTQLTLCAIATPEDINKPLGTEITDKDEILQLAKLSEQRLNAFKEYMVEEQGIASSRLLLCLPKIDSSIEAKPRITFTD